MFWGNMIGVTIAFPEKYPNFFGLECSLPKGMGCADVGKFTCQVTLGLELHELRTLVKIPLFNHQKYFI